MPRARTLSTSFLEGSDLPVAGEVSLVLSHASMAARSYVWPSMVKTGSLISCLVIGQRSDEAMPSTTTAAEALLLCVPSFAVREPPSRSALRESFRCARCATPSAVVGGSEKLVTGCFLSSSTSCIDVPREERRLWLWLLCGECEPLERGESEGDAGVGDHLPAIPPAMTGRPPKSVGCSVD